MHGKIQMWETRIEVDEEGGIPNTKKKRGGGKYQERKVPFLKLEHNTVLPVQYFHIP